MAGAEEEVAGGEREQRGDIASRRGRGQELAEDGWARGGRREQQQAGACGCEQDLRLGGAAQAASGDGDYGLDRQLLSGAERSDQCAVGAVDGEAAGAGEVEVLLQEDAGGEGCGGGDRLERRVLGWGLGEVDGFEGERELVCGEGGTAGGGQGALCGEERKGGGGHQEGGGNCQDEKALRASHFGAPAL